MGDITVDKRGAKSLYPGGLEKIHMVGHLWEILAKDCLALAGDTESHLRACGWTSQCSWPLGFSAIGVVPLFRRCTALTFLGLPGPGEKASDCNTLQEAGRTTSDKMQTFRKSYPRT